MLRRAPYLLVLAVLGLIVLGLIVLFSAGAFAKDGRGDIYYFIKRQAAWVCLGIGAATFAALVDYHFWRRIHFPLLCLSLLLLVLCYVPPIGTPANGAWRWIGIGHFSFQPSELARLAVIVFLASAFSRPDEEINDFRKGFLVPLAWVGAAMLLIVGEVDLGCTALIGSTALSIMFVAGVRLRYLGTLVLMAAVTLGGLVSAMPERAARLLAFLNPEDHAGGSAYQFLQGRLAMGSGGFWGVGVGNSRFKMDQLPFAHTDFIFAIIGEELGFRFTVLVVLSFLVILLSGAAIAMSARDRFGMLLAFGLTFAIALQAAINLGVVTGLLPNKGMPLPFISYGGSNLLLSLLAIGILLNIYRHGIHASALAPAPPRPSPIAPTTSRLSPRL